MTKINNSFWVHSIDFRLKGPKISLKQPLPDDAGKNPANIQNVCINLKLRIRLQFSSRKTFFFSVFKQTFFAVSPLLALSFQSVFMCQTKFSDDDDDGTFESCFSFHCVLISLLIEVCKTCQSLVMGELPKIVILGSGFPKHAGLKCKQCL